jgi:rRNA maturation protein Nop10
MNRSPKQTNDAAEGKTAGAPDDRATMRELCPRCGTEFCVGCGNSELKEGECPTCSQALVPAEPA